MLHWRVIRMVVPIVSSVLVCVPGRADETLARIIDREIAIVQRRDGILPGPLADDPEFVRRLYLDLIGRIPTAAEARRFCADRNSAKRGLLIDELLASSEFIKHWRENLNLVLMGGPAFGGNPQWRAWLESALDQHQAWDTMARTMLLARSDKPEQAGAYQFLLARYNQGASGLDAVTRDVSRIFFGVDIQCARCHKHPEVKQWKQESYWSMAAYFNRSYPLTLKSGQYLAEKATGEVEYTPKGKPATIARPVFLTGEALSEPARPRAAAAPAPAQPAKGGKVQTPPADDPADYLVAPDPGEPKTRVPVPKFSRRAKFVETAINPGNPYFKRAAVNLIWKHFFGRGLVEPIDQMHDANPASHPELLLRLGDAFAAQGFDLGYLIRGILNSQTYQRTSRYPSAMTRPPETSYALSNIRPLSPHQLALSLLVAAGYAHTEAQTDAAKLRTKLESQHAGLLASLVKDLDSGTEPYQAGVREALFQSNNATFAEMLLKGGRAAQLSRIADNGLLVHEAYWSVLSRPPSDEEEARLREYLDARTDRKSQACEQIVWAVITSSEMRFNH
jgi:hypothetical protein